jgi:flagellar biosynthesis/type III secretory pathway protein FliH
MYHPRDKEKEAKGRHGETMPTKSSQFMVLQQQKQETQKIFETLSQELPYWDDTPQPQSQSQSRSHFYTEEEAQELVEKAYQEGWQEGLEEGYKLGKDKGYKEHKVLQEEEEEAKKASNQAKEDTTS